MSQSKLVSNSCCGSGSGSSSNSGDGEGGSIDDDNGGGNIESGGLRQQSTQSGSGRNDGGSNGRVLYLLDGRLD